MDAELTTPALPTDDSLFFIMCKELSRAAHSLSSVQAGHPSSNQCFWEPSELIL